TGERAGHTLLHDRGDAEPDLHHRCRVPASQAVWSGGRDGGWALMTLFSDVELMRSWASMLAWRPFRDPLNVHTTWYLFLIPMAFLISVVYRAVRMKTLDQYWQQVVVMTVQIVLGMIALAVASYLFVVVYVRFIAQWIAGG